jgi:hypothetical protein
LGDPFISGPAAAWASAIAAASPIRFAPLLDLTAAAPAPSPAALIAARTPFLSTSAVAPAISAAAIVSLTSGLLAAGEQRRDRAAQALGHFHARDPLRDGGRDGRAIGLAQMLAPAKG